MDARALPGKLFEWLFRPAALRDARRELPAAGDTRVVAARQAKLGAPTKLYGGTLEQYPVESAGRAE